MQNSNEQNRFSYTYSAKDQAELKKIREKYAPQSEEEDKMARLRRLDASVARTAQAVALVFGVLGTLILGFGMSLCMSDLFAAFGIGKNTAFVVGIAVGVVGGILASLAYPIYNAIIRHKRKKLAPEILRLADELMK